MKTTTTTPANRNLPGAGRILLATVAVFAMVACQKEVINPVAPAAAQITAPAVFGNFRVNDTKVTLLQGNENIKALTLRWDAANNATYTVEAATYGTNFADVVELGTTDQAVLDLNVKDLNRKACQLIPAGQTGMIEIRTRANNGKDVLYTNAAALQVTTYLQYNEFAQPNFMKVPGNYQEWNVADAPKIVNAAQDGVFTGFVKFTNPYTQVLLLKDVAWNPLTTYYNIGAGKFGFKGNMFCINGGAGLYQLTANTNTNTWNYTKINTFGINGTAAGANNGKDAEMTYDDATMTWTINITLNPGTFRIRANNDNAITFGQKTADGYKVPDTKGADFTVATAGTYLITLNLQLAGNYACTVARTIAN